MSGSNIVQSRLHSLLLLICAAFQITAVFPVKLVFQTAALVQPMFW